jgi:hypothetical protein
MIQTQENIHNYYWNIIYPYYRLIFDNINCSLLRSTLQDLIRDHIDMLNLIWRHVTTEEGVTIAEYWGGIWEDRFDITQHITNSIPDLRTTDPDGYFILSFFNNMLVLMDYLQIFMWVCYTLRCV